MEIPFVVKLLVIAVLVVALWSVLRTFVRTSFRLFSKDTSSLEATINGKKYSQTSTKERALGTTVYSKKLLGYSQFSAAHKTAGWMAVYECNTARGMLYLGVHSDGYCGTSWLDGKPTQIYLSPPEFFPEDPWTTVGLK
jgi:hypothetical protein